MGCNPTALRSPFKALLRDTHPENSSRAGKPRSKNMKRFIAIPARILGFALLTAAALQSGANAGSLDERFKASVNTAIQNVEETKDPAVKREMLGKFLTRMDQGLGMAKTGASESDARALGALQLKL